MQSHGALVSLTRGVSRGVSWENPTFWIFLQCGLLQIDVIQTKNKIINVRNRARSRPQSKQPSDTSPPPRQRRAQAPRLFVLLSSQPSHLSPSVLGDRVHWAAPLQTTP